MNNSLAAFSGIFASALEDLATELEEFPEEKLWVLPPGINNPGGSLFLHLCGNLRHFIGSSLGNTGYIRNRDYEFSARGLSKSEIRNLIQVTREEVINSLANLNRLSPSDKFPFDNFGPDVSWLQGLMKISTHLSYHLGQINYLRRILKG